MRKAGQRVRIAGQLIDAVDGVHLWADRFDGSLDDIFELQDHVASSVVGAIEPKLYLSEIKRAIRKPTESLDAYDLYLSLRRSSTGGPSKTRVAIDLLRQALALDSRLQPWVCSHVVVYFNNRIGRALRPASRRGRRGRSGGAPAGNSSESG